MTSNVRVGNHLNAGCKASRRPFLNGENIFADGGMEGSACTSADSESASLRDIEESKTWQAEGSIAFRRTSDVLGPLESQGIRVRDGPQTRRRSSRRTSATQLFRETWEGLPLVKYPTVGPTSFQTEDTFIHYANANAIVVGCMHEKLGVLVLKVRRRGRQRGDLSKNQRQGGSVLIPETGGSQGIHKDRGAMIAFR
jgi:hypothetical protein